MEKVRPTARYAAEFYARNPERRKQLNREYMARLATTPEGRARLAEWARRSKATQRQRDPVRYWLYPAVYAANRRAKKLGRPGKLVLSEVIAKFEQSGSCCVDCGAKGFGKAGLHLGHAVPICFEGSENSLWNIIFQCRSCNTKQHNAVHPSAGRWKLVRVE
jgi:5-methylcytosine-specific restriction endonuclease McrA